VTTTQRQLRGGGRFEVTVVGDVVTKRGDARSLAREAAGLRKVAGLDLVPAIVASRRGALSSQYLRGRTRMLKRISDDHAHELGHALRRLHESHRSASGGLPHWPGPARSLTAYRQRRSLDTLAAAGPADSLARRVVAALPPTDTSPTDQPFRMLHGDLAGANIVWTPSPRFVDLEFWRMGDPAEDLAYLIEVNGIPQTRAHSILDGYGVPDMADRVEAWRALCALDAGIWYRTTAQAAPTVGLIVRAAALTSQITPLPA
jgi:aminoglycoside phosphotransferase (APT) family kinase protein